MKSLRIPVIALLLFTIGAGLAQAATSQKKYSVFVSIPPQAYFLERIAQDRAHIHVLVGPGQSPASYEPSPKQMANLADSKLFFTIGVPFERVLLRKIKSAFKGLKVVDTAKGIELREIDSHSESGHGHGKGRDPHTWLDPILVKTQAHNIYEALAQTDPANKSAYQKNLDSFLKDLDRIDQRISKALSDLKNRKILVFHPAYGYFCDRYGLEQIPVETGGKQPSPKQLADLIEKARQIKARVIFVQPQFDESSARTIAESIQGAVVKLDPLARDYLNNLWKMAEKIAESLNDEQGQGR